MAEENAFLPRHLLEKYFGDDPRLVSAFETQAQAVQEIVIASDGTVTATDALVDATVITLSPNAVFNNEFVLANGDGTKLTFSPGTVKVDLDNETVARCEGSVKFISDGFITLFVPTTGTLLSDVEEAKVYNKQLVKPLMSGLVDASTQAAAAAAGVPVGGVYRDGTTLKIRIS